MIKGELLLNEPLSRHTTWRVGGHARQYFKPYDSADLIEFLKTIPDTEALFWLGLGSNILVRDGGFAGTVIATAGRLNKFEQIDADSVRVEAGVPCAIVARQCAKLGLTGIEFFSGIPGTLGGALAMNAGAFGSETWAWVETVKMVNRSGQTLIKNKKQFEISYRSVKKEADTWFLSADIRLDKGDVEKNKLRIKKLLKKRSDSQPTQRPNCGSVFKNPENDHAARLIEQAGLKGVGIGQAEISTKHANFIINKGDASARDIEALMLLIMNKVEEKFDVKLTPEVKIIGIH